jgi:hypothetical protein
MAGTPATKPETLLRRLASDKSVPGRIRLRAIEWLMLMEKKITWEQFPQDSKADKEAGLSALAGMVRESPSKTRETFADATAHGPQIDPANSIDD